MSQNKLKATEIKDYRDQLLLKQGSRCALCGDQIPTGKEVLDHDHKTGYIRGVLHRGCNALLGKIENSLPMNDISNVRLTKIAHNLMHYLTYAKKDVLHPTHFSPEEKKEKRRASAARARKKKRDSSRTVSTNPTNEDV